jgi:hypothetical protein
MKTKEQVCKESRISVAKRSAALGLPYSNARVRLMRSILFDMSKRLGCAWCFRCGKEISESDFSVDHKRSWLMSDDPRTLFFDLNNVAFSHNRCNSSAQERGIEAISGFRGVHFDKSLKRRAQCWTAKVRFNGKYRFAGRFNKAEDAAKAYNELAIKLLGPSAKLNKLG